MTLRKQTVHIGFDGTVNEAAHPFTVEAPGNLEVYDARHLNGGAIGKRFGVEAATDLTNATPDMLTTGGLHTLTEHGGRLLAITHDGGLAEDEASGRWERAGSTGPRPSQAKTDPVIRGNNSARHSDMAILEDFGPNGVTLACVVWHDDEADVCMYSWHEVPSDGRPMVLVYGPKAFTDTGTPGLNITRCPRVAVNDGQFFAIGTDGSGTGGSNLNGAIADPTVSYDFSTPALIDAALASANNSAIEVVGGTSSDKAWWCVYPIGSSDYRVSRHTTAGGVTPILTKDSTGECLGACYVDGAKNVILVALAAGNVDEFDTLLVSSVITHTLITPTASVVHAATITQCTSSGGAFVAWSGVANPNPDAGGLTNFGVDFALLSAGTFAGISQGLISQVRLGGTASWDGSSRAPLVPLLNDQVFRDPALLPFRSGYVGVPCTDGLDYSMAQVASYGIDTATLFRSFWDLEVVAGERYHQLPSCVYTGGQHLMVYPVFTDETDPLDVTCGLDAFRLATYGSASLRSVTAQSLRLSQSGVGLSYMDGVFYAENTPPPLPYVAVSGHTATTPYSGNPSGGGGDPAPTIYVSFALRWRDAQGNIHRSLPSFELGLAWWVLDTGVYYPAQWTFPRPWPCSMLGEKATQHYEVEVYQADVTNGTMYFRGTATPIPHPTLAACDMIVPTTVAFATAQENISIVTTPSSAGTVTRWTDLGELQHIPPPPFADVCSTQARVWGLSAEKGRLEVWPSKLLVEGYAPEFPVELVQRIPAEGGECTAIAALDDKVVIFKERAIFVLFGDPGTNTGQRATIQPARLISSDVGCSNPRSVVEGPFGVAFQASSDSTSGRAGIHVLGRGLELTYPGAAVKETVAGVTFQAGTLLAAEKEVRWIMSGLRVLVWSYDVEKWHIHTARAAQSATVRRGRYAAQVTETGILIDQAGWDETSIHRMQIVTPWVRMAGLQGFQRCWCSTHLFRRFGSHLKIEIAYNYKGGWDVLDAHSYSTGTLDGLTDATSGRVQVLVHHRIQKCESFRFRITEDTSNDTGSRGLEYLGTDIEVGIKPSSFRRALPKAAAT